MGDGALVQANQPTVAIHRTLHGQAVFQAFPDRGRLANGDDRLSIHIIGVYGAVPLFLIFYMRFLGRHRWLTTGALAASTPVVLFLFFEIALRITLPKGLTEPLFYPLYAIFF